MGVPTKVASSTIMNDPKIAFAKPPPSSLGGGVICVNKLRLKPPKPSRKVSHNIQSSQNTPNAIASSDKVKAK
jgi:hypothetical protein